MFLMSSLSFLLTLIVLLMFALDGLGGTAVTIIITYYLHLSIDAINSQFNAVLKESHLKPQILYSEIKYYFTEHNNCCKQIRDINALMQNLWLIFLITLVPASMIIMHQVIFEEMDYSIKILLIETDLIWFLLFFITQYFMASVSRKLHSMGKHLPRLQSSLKRVYFSFGFKIKVLTYFESLISRRKIGLSIGSLSVITSTLFAQVYHLMTNEHD